MSYETDYICEAIGQCPQYSQRFLSSFEEEGEARGYADDATWILTSSFVIFTMQTGFGLLEMGSGAAGYEVNILMKNVMDVVFGGLAYFLLGYGISFGNPSIPFMGLGDFAPSGGSGAATSGLLFSRYIFQLSFAATATTIVSGCVAMRMRFFVYCTFSFFAVFAYAFVAHWIFASDGWLVSMGVHDHAGGGPVHLFGGMNGLIAILFVGNRTGRFDGSRPASDFLPVSPTSTLFGLFMLWWGWIGFNCGSSFGITNDRWVVATRSAITTINSTSAGGICSLLVSLYRTKGRMLRPAEAVNGILGALVAITPTCACVQTWAAFPIGAIGCCVSLGVNKLILKLHIDDPVGAIGAHAGAAVWGLIAVGLFADGDLVGVDVDDGLFRGGGWRQLGVQLLAIVAVIGWSVGWAVPFFYLLGVFLSGDWRNPRLGLRVSKEEEEVGADVAVHGIGREAPEDTDDNTIKAMRNVVFRSYHGMDDEDHPGAMQLQADDEAMDRAMIREENRRRRQHLFRSFRAAANPKNWSSRRTLSTFADEEDMSSHHHPCAGNPMPQSSRAAAVLQTHISENSAEDMSEEDSAESGGNADNAEDGVEVSSTSDLSGVEDSKEKDPSNGEEL